MRDLAAMIRATLPTEDELAAMELRSIETAKNNFSCFTHWFPAVEGSGVHHPRSLIIDFPNDLTKAIINGNFDPSDLESLESITEQISEFGDQVGCPIFLKNSLCSAKHHWADTCFIVSKEDIPNHITEITNFWACVGSEKALHLIAREMIPTSPVFHAFAGQMPVTKEFRLFATDGVLNGWQPYWPEFAIKKPSDENWRELLKSISTPPQRS